MYYYSRLNPFLIRATFERFVAEIGFTEPDRLNPFLIRATFERYGNDV